MGYSRDKDYYTRGVGAIAALDKHGARQLARRRRAQALLQHDHTMASIAKGAGRGGMAALGAFGRIATDNGGEAGTATGQPGGRPPTTPTNPVTRPGKFMPGKVTTNTFAPTPKTPRQSQPGGTFQPGVPTGPRTGGGSSSPINTTSGGVPVRTTPSSGGVVVDQQTIPGSGSGIPGPLDMPELVAVTDQVVTTQQGMSLNQKLALAGGAAAALYLLFGRK